MATKMLSIIVPVYNVSRYLYGCIESILNQEFQDFELILVDDGSVDDSGKICDEYAGKDNRIHVIHQKNGGVSSARNTGIENASGKYIAFVDADDTMEPNMYSTMVTKAEQSGSDYVICGLKILFANNTEDILYSLPENVLMNRDSVIKVLLYSIYSNENIINSPCNKLYRLDLIRNNQIRFLKRRRAEDWLFNIRYLENSQSALYINEPLYNYVRNNESVMSRVLPEQYEIWKENAQIRKEIAERYQMAVDWKEVNKNFLMGVIPWVVAMYKQTKDFNFNSVLEDKDFKDACINSHRLDSLKTEFIREMINMSLPGVARLLCKI
ncbi:MAG: glycosyltransferase [Bacteroidaceae bacterium]|nr:glycosyltransferase [Bacteroidaceae bacterium]